MPLPAVIAAHPQLSLFAVQAASQLLGNLLANRRQSQYQREAAKEQKFGNLISALSQGRIPYSSQAVPRAPGFLESLAGGVGTGAQLLGMGLQASQADKLAQSQLTGEQLRAELAQRALDAQTGQAAAERQFAFERNAVPAVSSPQIVTPIAARPRMTPTPPRIAPASIQLSPPAMAEPLTGIGEAGYLQQLRQLRQQDVQGRFEAELQGLQIEAAKQGIQINQLAILRDVATMGQETDVPPAQLLAIANAYGTLSPGLTRQEFEALPEVSFVLQGGGASQGATSLYRAYQVASQNRAEKLTSEMESRLDRFTNDLRLDKTVADKPELTRALNQIFSAIEVGSGVGDVQLIKMLARLQDPNSVVRTEEYQTVADAVSAWERAGISLKGIFTGQKLTDEGRLRILELATNSYNDRLSDIQAIVSGAISQRVDLLGPDVEPLFRVTAQRFLLPALDMNRLERVQAKLRLPPVGALPPPQEPVLLQAARLDSLLGRP